MNFLRPKYLWLLPLGLLWGCSSSSSNSWKTYNSDEFGVSLDSFYPVQFKVTQTKVKNSPVPVKLLYGHAENPTPKALDIALFTFRTLSKQKTVMEIFKLDLFSHIWNKPYDSKSLVDGTVKRLGNLKNTKEDITDFQYQNKKILCSGMPATLTSGNFQIAKKGFSTNIYFENLLVVRKDQYWQLYCTYQDKDRYEESVQKIIQSIHIKPTAP